MSKKWRETEFKDKVYPKTERFRVNITGRATAVVRDPEYYHSDVVVVLIKPFKDYEREALFKGERVSDALDFEEDWMKDHPYADVEGSFWGGRGRTKPLMDDLQDYIPKMGAAGEEGAELARAIQRIYYDYYNNGFGNLETMDDYVSTIRDHREKIKTRLVNEENYQIWSDGIRDAKDMMGGHRDTWKDPFKELGKEFEDALEDVTNACVMLGHEMVNPGLYDSSVGTVYNRHYEGRNMPQKTKEFLGGDNRDI